MRLLTRFCMAAISVLGLERRGKMGKQNSRVFELRTEGLHLRLRFSSPDYEGWISVFAEVSAEPFSGTYAFQMLSGELRTLLEKLEELDRSVGKVVEISWKNVEDNIELRLSLNSRGQIVGHYQFSPGLGGEGANLSGGFHADQSYLGDWIRQLRRI